MHLFIVLRFLEQGTWGGSCYCLLKFRENLKMIWHQIILRMFFITKYHNMSTNMTNPSWIMVLSWFGVSSGITIIFLALICFLLECRYSICWRYDSERGNAMFEMTPSRRRSNKNDFIPTPPCLCGRGSAVLNTQRKGGRRNNSCPVWKISGSPLILR